jgi:hypothetical protein
MLPHPVLLTGPNDGQNVLVPKYQITAQRSYEIPI